MNFIIDIDYDCQYRYISNKLLENSVISIDLNRKVTANITESFKCVNNVFIYFNFSMISMIWQGFEF